MLNPPFLYDDRFNPGAMPDRADSRTVTVSRAQEAGIMGAPAIDWEKGYDVETDLGIELAVKNQGTSLSCVGNAWSYYAALLEARENGGNVAFSARDVYSQIFLPTGGAVITEGAKLLTKKGIETEAALPVPANATEALMRYRADATLSGIAAALAYKAKSYISSPSYANVELAMDTFAQMILEGTGCVTGATGSNPGWRDAGGLVRPPESGEIQWGHAFTCISFGLVHGKKAIGFKNSWGDGWGAGGYGYLTEEYFQSGNVFGATIALDLPNSWITDALSMLNVLRRPGGTDLFVIGKDGRAYRITDQETWDYLKLLGVVAPSFAEPTLEDFAHYPYGGNFPSKKLMDALSPVAKDVFGIA